MAFFGGWIHHAVFATQLQLAVELECAVLDDSFSLFEAFEDSVIRTSSWSECDLAASVCWSLCVGERDVNDRAFACQQRCARRDDEGIFVGGVFGRLDALKGHPTNTASRTRLTDNLRVHRTDPLPFSFGLSCTTVLVE